MVEVKLNLLVKSAVVMDLAKTKEIYSDMSEKYVF